MEFVCRAVHNRTYRILLEWGLLSRVREVFAQQQWAGPFYIISDRNVYQYHGRKLARALKPFETHNFIVQPGESSKSLNNWKRIQEFLLSRGADRRSVVIAFGGGVIGDLAGFAASTFMRGMKLVQIPTTLLSQADSSIGSKVAVNHPLAKNLIGSFYQPELVITDPSLLTTLPKREFSAGLGEAIKYGVILDPDLFDTLYEHVETLLTLNKEHVRNLIARCIQMKIRIVEQDERETGLRKILNFGHTVGHALEQATNYRRLRHGEAVGWGMLAAGRLATQRGMWDTAEFDKLKSILIRAKCLYPPGKISPARILKALKHDKKKTGKNMQFMLPVRTGEVVPVSEIPEKQVLEAVQYMLRFRR
jgi:3-dehydroquinate synthase